VSATAPRPPGRRPARHDSDADADADIWTDADADIRADVDLVDGAARRALPDEPLGRWFWLALLVGGAIMAYGVVGAIGQQADTQPPQLLRFAVGSLLAHDAVLAPLVTVAGIVAARVLPTWLRGPVRGGLALTGIVVLFSYPLLRAFGRHPLNDSTLPQDYPRNVAVVVALIWIGAASMAVVRWREARR